MSMYNYDHYLIIVIDYYKHFIHPWPFTTSNYELTCKDNEPEYYDSTMDGGELAYSRIELRDKEQRYGSTHLYMWSN